MNKNLPPNDVDILNFRPNIVFSEPLVESEVAKGKIKGPEPAEVKEEWGKVSRTAEAAAILAEAVQAKVDNKVGDFFIGLDPVVDRPVADALRRMGKDPTKITFDQYRECRRNLRDRGDSMARGLIPDVAEMKNIRSNLDQDIPIAANSPAAKQGLNRPELDKKAQFVEPLDMDSFQEMMLKMLMNLLWKKFLKPALTPVIPPPFNDLLPDEIA